MKSNSTEEKEIISRCISGERKAQFELYRIYSPKMYGICMRYAKNKTDAEDILQEGFIKVFRYLKDYRGEGAFEGWIRRIMITTSLNFYKKKNLVNKDVDPETIRLRGLSHPDAVSKMAHEELLSLIQELPNGYRTVFNLNTIEGYSHKEISEILQISINTSKSQLSRAKSSLKDKISKMFLLENDEVKLASVF
jgi:RNA polymerase sigma-70 factor (ECF subfamily)